MFLPLILILIGIASLVNALGIYPVNWDVAWPALLIVLGVYMIARRNRRCRTCNGCKDCGRQGTCSTCLGTKGCKDCKDCTHCASHA